MLTVFRFAPWDKDNLRAPSRLATALLFDIINNNAGVELKDLETARHLNDFDEKLREVMNHIETDKCGSCGRNARDYWELKEYGGFFAVEKGVFNTIKDIFKRTIPKMPALQYASVLATDKLFKSCDDISESDWTKLRETDNDKPSEVAEPPKDNS